MLSDISEKISEKQNIRKTAFEIKNETQFFQARDVSLIYIKASILEQFIKYLAAPMWLPEEKTMMTKLTTLYGLWCLEEHMSSLLR